MHWPMIGWIAPLGCMLMMVVMCLLMAGFAGMRCMSRTGSWRRPDPREPAEPQDRRREP
jgi:hypothetical protein